MLFYLFLHEFWIESNEIFSIKVFEYTASIDILATSTAAAVVSQKKGAVELKQLHVKSDFGSAPIS